MICTNSYLCTISFDSSGYSTTLFLHRTPFELVRSVLGRAYIQAREPLLGAWCFRGLSLELHRPKGRGDLRARRYAPWEPTTLPPSRLHSGYVGPHNSQLNRSYPVNALMIFFLSRIYLLKSVSCNSALLSKPLRCLPLIYLWTRGII